MKLKIQHIGCGGDIELIDCDDGACGDPECCGGTSYYITARCKKCGVEKSHWMSGGEKIISDFI